jgi:peptidyl-prolyl cis-trans isomerase SurA
MKLFLSFSILALFVTIPNVYSTSRISIHAQHDPHVWAVVNGKEITESEVDKYYRSREGDNKTEPSQQEARSQRLEILEELINNELVLERASKMNLIATDAEVEDKFRESKSPYTEEEFQRKLHDMGLTVDDLKSDIRRQLSVQKLLNLEVIAKISITDQEVTDFYNKNRAQFNVAEPQYHIAQIVVTSHPDSSVHNRKNDKAKTDAEAKSKVAMLEQKLASGTDFGQLAMDYSEDSTATNAGDLGFVPQSALDRSDPTLKKIVLAMQTGEVSQPIAVQSGYLILKLIAKEPAGQRELSDPRVQQSIRDILGNREQKELSDAYVADLRAKANVINYEAQSAETLPSRSDNPSLPVDEPTLPDTAEFIKDKLNTWGKVSVVAVTKDAVHGTSVTSVLNETASNVTVDASTCKIGYHWATTRRGQIQGVQNVQFSLKDIAKVEIMPLPLALNKTNIAEGHPELTVQSTEPKLWTILVVRNDAPKQYSHFSFDDQNLADRVAKALTHAAELCGAGETKEPF